MIIVDYIEKKKKMRVSWDASDVIKGQGLREHFSVPNPGATFARRAGKRFVADRLYAITSAGYCAPGLWQEILKYFRDNQVTGIDFTDSFKAYIGKSYDVDVADEFTYELFAHQFEAVKKSTKRGSGICVLATGAGKTLTCASLAQSYYNECADKENFRCLIIVPNIGLVEQTYKDFEEYGVKFTFSKWSGDNDLDTSTNVVIAGQSIMLNRCKGEMNAWVYDVDVAIVDEVHSIKASNKITEIIEKLKTERKFGFTGTMPTNLLERWHLIGLFGPVLMEKNSFELRNENILTNVSAKCIHINYKGKHKLEYNEELELLHTHKFRNNVIKKLCQGYNNNILIIVNRVAHGLHLKEVLEATGKKVYFVQGSVDVDDRAEIIKIMENSSDVVCIAISKIFSVGINIKNLHYLIFAAGGKAFIRTVQSIGRGLRKHPTKEIFTIIDICDELKYGQMHSEKRKVIYDIEKIKYSVTSITEP